MTSNAFPADLPELERRMKWRVIPTLMFLGFLGALLTAAIVSLFVAPRRPQGVPDVPAVRAAQQLLAGQVGVPTGELRFRAALFGGDPHGTLNEGERRARLIEARAWLVRARAEAGGDARLDAAFGALALAARDDQQAERDYRRAIERMPHYGEARLGMGVALAERADRTSEHWQARALRLRAIAQFAMVGSADPAYPPALWNRVWLLSNVGRDREARRFTERYLAIDSTSSWAESLRRIHTP